MDSAVLLSVLAITYTVVLARPADMDLRTKRSIETGEIFNPEFIKLPTELKREFTITINGTIDPETKSLEVVFPAEGQEETEHCRLIYNFDTKTLDVLPPPPEESNTITPYTIPRQTDPSNFSIKLSARATDQNNMFKITFEAQGGGVSSMMTCPTTDFSTHGYINFKNGVHSITSLLFEFN